MKDIALRAGVSIGTVSRVLSGKQDVAPQLAAKVKTTALELGYARHPVSRREEGEGAQLGTIAYLVDRKTGEIASEPFQQEFLAGIDDAVTERGGHVLFAACGDDFERKTVPTVVSRKLVTGAIVKGEADEEWLASLSALLPVVLLMSQSESRAFPSVCCDNHNGMHQALRHLREWGHRRIGFYFEKERVKNHFSHIEREEAFRRYAPALGCPVLPGYIQTPFREKGEELHHTAERALRGFLDLGRERPTAVVCGADIFAFTLLRAAAQQGLRVPEDLSVVSFMNTSACEHSHPPLTSISLNGQALGRAAVELLCARAQSPRGLVQHIAMETRLVPRASCAPPPF